MKSFYEYLSESVKEYSYRIKTINGIDDVFLEQLSKALQKYDLVSVSKIKKTISQKTPMDFPEVKNTAVWMVDVTVRIPVSSFILHQELYGLFQMAAGAIVVRADHEPLELQTTALNASMAMSKEAKGRDLVSKAKLDDPDYSEAPDLGEPAYGDSYNQKFLNYLAQVAANREEPDVGKEIKKDPKFAWLNVNDDFNKDIDGVKPVHRGTKKIGAKATPPADVDTNGAFDDTGKKFKQNYKTKDGWDKTLERSTKEIRKDKGE